MQALRRGAVTGILLGLVLSLTPATAYARPHNPTDGEIKKAQQEKTRKAAEVGRLTGLVAQADGQMVVARDRAELAVEKWNKAVVDLRRATANAARAKAVLAGASRQVATAQQRFSRYVRGSYMQGSMLNSPTALLDAKGPTDLLQRADLLAYAGRRQLDAIGSLERARIRQGNAESAARAALALQQTATVNAARAKTTALGELAGAKAALARLQKQRAGLAAQLAAARIKLNGLLAERVRFQQWQKAQAIAAAKEKARQKALRAAALARRAAAESAAGGGGGGSRWTGGGSWTPAMGRHVVDAAMRWLGTPYAWGGGNASGPTYGINGPGAGYRDGSVYGFDCSGLALHAWAQVGVSLSHYSGYQYQSGRHIAPGDLMPGDLVFWAYNTSDPGTIHHVAIYLGGGQIVQAPQSGDVVKVSPMYYDGYIGATRPGT